MSAQPVLGLAEPAPGDIAKAHIDIHSLPDGRSWRLDYTPKMLAGLIRDLEKGAPALIVLEASGGYERPCADALAGAGLAPD